jgi:glycine dehydrogenase subunit 2
MDAFTVQPAAGAHGELTGIMVMKKYFAARGEKRTHILIPDTPRHEPGICALCVSP